MSELAALAPIARPAGVEPVKDTTRTWGSSISASPTSAPPGSMWNTPGGTPAASSSRARITPPQTLVRGSGLRTTAFPSASAGATERMDRTKGTLKGEMTATTPAGMRRSMLIRGCGEWSSSPYGAVASVAASRHSAAHTAVSSRPRPRVPPDSRVTHSTMSPACSSNSSAARRRTAARSNGLRSAQAGCVCAARAAAAVTSAASAAPTRSEHLARRRRRRPLAARRRPHATHRQISCRSSSRRREGSCVTFRVYARSTVIYNI